MSFGGIFKASPQIEADRRLLYFQSYEDYLDSLGTQQDECYLQSLEVSRSIAELGYRSSGETLRRAQFDKRLNAVYQYLYPPYKPYESASEGLVRDDPLKMDLALRERATPQIEADKRLLKYHSYEDYLESLANYQDECYLQSVEISRTIAELGYRNSGETLNRKQFEKRLAAVYQYIYPIYKPYEASSEGLMLDDPLKVTLSLRERSNRVGILSTIIFLKYVTKAGFEISGYIDYGEKLAVEDWKPFFKGSKKIMPRVTDLGYYHWRSGKVVSNDSRNYKVLQDPSKGLVFQNRFDRKVINPAPGAEAGANTTRKRVYTPMYELVILFDHVVRQRI